MRKRFVTICLVLAAGLAAHAQKFGTRTGNVSFFSKSPLENIKAENNQAYAVIDAGKKNLAIALLLKGFIFEKELMQTHFNENYVESDKYPKANFNGTFEGSTATLDKDGNYQVTVKGTLSLHNVTKTIEVPATLKKQGNSITGNANFKVKPEDYNISIPSIVRDKIASEITVTVNIDCNSMN